ncbi:MAG: FtsX-like permease family protein [Marinoscillum sp.]
MSHHQPPKTLTRLLQLICREEFYEELQGDLEERYYRDVEEKGTSKARRKYNLEMIRLIRPSVIKSPTISKSMNQLSMLRNYTVVAFRNIKRQKLFSAINIIGLAISMAVGLITISFITEMESYDEFHTNLNRLYRIGTTRTNHINDSNDYASTSLLLGDRLEEEYAAADQVVSMFKGLWGDLNKDEKLFNFSGLYTSHNFFEAFSFTLKSGNPQTALAEPNSMVITEDLAMKVFGSIDVVGETVKKGNLVFTITGIANNPPKNSHIQFDALASLATIRNMEEYEYLFEWNTMWSSYVYVMLPQNHNITDLKIILDKIVTDENSKMETFSMNPNIDAMADIFPGDGQYNQLGNMMQKSYIKQVIILALIVLFSACFNYANLSIARSLKRAKEIGIRKVIGARKSQLFNQFVLEAIVVAFISLVFAFGLFVILRPSFIALDYSTIKTTTLELTPQIILYFVAFAILIGALAGMIPSALMTKFSPLAVLKGISMRGDRGISIRKVMVAVQFTLSIGLATLVYLTYQQYQFALNFDLGFTTNNILNVDLHGNKPEVLRSAFEQLPEVKMVSHSSLIPSTGNLNSDEAKIVGEIDSIVTYSNYVDANYLQNFDHELIAGENFRETGDDQMIVNETFLNAFGIKNNQDALGKRITYYDRNRTIVGVVKDFHYGTIYNTIKPFAFLHKPELQPEYFNLKIQSTNILTTLDKLDEVWSEIDPHHEFDGTFYDVQIQGFYKHMEAKMKMYGLLAVIAISISMLGLLGMVIYTTESRIKELTIRKVLGASVSNLIILVGSNFSWIFLFATAISIPASYYLYQQLSNSIAHKAPLNLFELIYGAIPIIAISLLVILSQSLKAAQTNPAETLRND